MAEVVAPIRSRRLPFWAMIIALVICALAGVFTLLWFKLPTWAPGWVVEHSPWVDPIVRAVEVEPGHWESASKRMGRWGPSVVPAMIDYLDDETSTVRELAAVTLGEFQDDRAIIPLINQMRVETQDSGTQEVARALQEALLKQNSPAVATVLLPLPTTSDMTAMIFIECAGRVHDDRMVPALRQILWEPASGSEGTPEAKKDDLFKMFGGRGGVAASSLSHSPCPSALPVLLSAFADLDPAIRRRAVHGVLHLYQRDVSPSLAEAVRLAISDEDPQVRQTAAMTAAIVRIPDVEDSLLTLSERNDSADRLAAIRGLGAKWASERAIQRLTECLETPDPTMQLAVVRALNRTSNPTSVMPLLSALFSADAKVRKEACKALFWKPQREDPRVFPALLRMLDDPDDAVSSEALRSLNAVTMTDEQRTQVKIASERRSHRDAGSSTGSGP